MTIEYHVIAIAAYLCILAVFVLALVFGLRARRNVKKEEVTKLPGGLSPLDIQRIFIGKTYPRKLTRALLAWWAERGYIKLIQAGKYTVRVTVLERPPFHSDPDAVFFDRGTYVREYKLFELFVDKYKDKPVSLLRPLFTRREVENVNDSFAVREDDGVYSTKHYKLKILTLVLSLAPLVMATVWSCVQMQNAYPIMLLAIAAIGYFVMMFVKNMPIVFKLIWCGLWLGASLGGLVVMHDAMYDPLYIMYAGVIMLFLGSFVLIRFVDYREKANLADYSDLVNYRKHLLFAPASELAKDDYYAALPYLYAFGIKFAVKRKFGERQLPEWFTADPDRKKGALL